jgi:alkylation response protein AidB-like acyl-CoA dehydrogenase
MGKDGEWFHTCIPMAREDRAMTSMMKADTAEKRETGIVATARMLGKEFAKRAAEADENDRFVAENYKALRDADLVAAGVPKELGGAGAEVAELAAMLRELAHHCGSTALAFAMHTHQVAIPAWRWRHQKVTAVEPLLRRVAAERIILLSSGGSDWIAVRATRRRSKGVTGSPRERYSRRGPRQAIS